MSAMTSDALWGTLIKFLLFFKKIFCIFYVRLCWTYYEFHVVIQAILHFFSVGVPQLEMTGKPGTSSSLWVFCNIIPEVPLTSYFSQKISKNFFRICFINKWWCRRETLPLTQHHYLQIRKYSMTQIENNLGTKITLQTTIILHPS